MNYSLPPKLLKWREQFYKWKTFYKTKMSWLNRKRNKLDNVKTLLKIYRGISRIFRPTWRNTITGSTFWMEKSMKKKEESKRRRMSSRSVKSNMQIIQPKANKSWKYLRKSMKCSRNVLKPQNNKKTQRYSRWRNK